MDKVSQQMKSVVIVGASSMPMESLDNAMLRTGRFDKVIELDKPNAKTRWAILQKLTTKMKLGSTVDLQQISDLAQGMNWSELAAVCSEAGMNCIRDNAAPLLFQNDYDLNGEDPDGALYGSINNVNVNNSPGAPGGNSVTYLNHQFCIEQHHFLHAVEQVQVRQQSLTSAACGSRKMDTSSTSANAVTWDQVGGTDKWKDDVKMMIEQPLQYPHIYRQYGVSPSCGVLLYGPPGCGKTMVARAIASSCKASFLTITAAEIMNQYVGESEKAIRNLFAQARQSSPCIVFIDEIDAIGE
jgi:ATP-dependent 26S proteasome regulatory subunit